MTPISSASFTQRISSTMSPESTSLALGAPSWIWARVDGFEDPAHPVYWAGIVEVHVYVLHPPQPYLVRLESGHKQRGITRGRNEHGERAFRRQMKVPGGVDHVVGVEQHQRVQPALRHLRLHLLDLALIPRRGQAVRAGRSGKVRRDFQHVSIAERTGGRS